MLGRFNGWKVSMRRKVSIQAVAFGLFLIANPAYFTACSSPSPEFEYDQADMLEVLYGLNEAGPFEWDDYSISLSFPHAAAKQAFYQPGAATSSGGMPFVAQAHACGTRSFVQPAEACGSTTEMQLQGTMTVARAEKSVDVVVFGTMLVMSRLLSHAYFEFYVDDFQLSLVWSEETGYEIDPEYEINEVNESALDALFASGSEE